jgi:tetratricopeptide (TPR) repeat protein
MCKKYFFSLFLLSFLVFQTIAQKPYLQVQTSGGYSMPMLELKEKHHFAENGWNCNLGFGMFFGKFGIMARGGYQRFSSTPLFKSFIFNQYKENTSRLSTQNWENAYGMIGPVFKWSLGRVDIDFFAKIGVSSLQVPDHIFTKTFIGQTTEIASYYGKNKELIPIWNGGISFHTRIGRNLNVFLEPSFMSNMYLSNTATTFRYVNATDVNRNGFIDDVEFVEAEIVKQVKETVFSNLNLNLGVSYQIGRNKTISEPVPMITLEDTIAVEKAAETAVDTKRSEPSSQEIKETGIKESPEETSAVEKSAVPAENQNSVTTKTMEEKRVVSTDSPLNNKIAEPAKINEETDYDEAAAKFLFKAGEMYYQGNDFENAVACFNKIKNDPNQMMAKYMFALSLAQMLNCEEAMAEYAEFSNSYKKDDAGVLHTVFISQMEECKKTVEEIKQKRIEQAQKTDALDGKNNMPGENTEANSSNPADINTNVSATSGKVHGNEKPSTTTSNDKNTVSPDKGKIYKVQFVALKISNKEFPKLENIGNITHEFFPKKSMYRYTLGPYTNEADAESDMIKVRAMGFDDAFLAEYTNGKRTNTLHHAR